MFLKLYHAKNVKKMFKNYEEFLKKKNVLISEVSQQCGFVSLDL